VRVATNAGETNFKGKREQVSEENDQLTGLRTRRALFLEVDRRLKNAEPVAILLLNIDRFKAVNDTFGVEVGNNVLRAIAAAVSTRADSYRFGGSAFAALAPLRSKDHVLQLAESIRADIDALSLDERFLEARRISN
jgi:diguanylate cyclase (GGDEF)-like protein